ncbi:unnamed protein product [Brassica rapa subsp. narinosa]
MCCSAVDVFPEVSLRFGGGASTVLTPNCYERATSEAENYYELFGLVSIDKIY